MAAGIQPGLKREREFGLVVGGVLVGVFGLLLPLWRHRALPWWPFAAGVPLVGLALAAPRALALPRRIWMGAGAVLGWVNTRMVLTVIFFAVVTPVGMLMRLSGRDPMRRRARAESYRVPSDPIAPERMKEPF